MFCSLNFFSCFCDFIAPRSFLQFVTCQAEHEIVVFKPGSMIPHLTDGGSAKKVGHQKATGKKGLPVTSP